MTKTYKKQVNFQKGMMNQKLNESSADALLLSCKEIVNFFVTIFGGLKKRYGSLFISLIDFMKSNLSSPIIKCPLYPNYKDTITNYSGSIIKDEKIIFDVTATDDNFQFATLNDLSVSNYNTTLSIMMQQETTPQHLELKGIVLSNNGSYYKSPPKLNFYFTNYLTDFDRLPIVNFILDSKGSIINYVINDGGFFNDSNGLLYNIDENTNTPTPELYGLLKAVITNKENNKYYINAFQIIDFDYNKLNIVFSINIKEDYEIIPVIDPLTYQVEVNADDEGVYIIFKQDLGFLDEGKLNNTAKLYFTIYYDEEELTNINNVPLSLEYHEEKVADAKTPTTAIISNISKVTIKEKDFYLLESVTAKNSRLYNENATLTFYIENQQSDEVIPTVKINLNQNKTINNIEIINAGSVNDLSRLKYNAITNLLPILINYQVQVLVNDIWIKIKDMQITTTPIDYIIDLLQPYNTMRLYITDNYTINTDLKFSSFDFNIKPPSITNTNYGTNYQVSGNGIANYKSTFLNNKSDSFFQLSYLFPVKYITLTDIALNNLISVTNLSIFDKEVVDAPEFTHAGKKNYDNSGVQLLNYNTENRFYYGLGFTFQKKKTSSSNYYAQVEYWLAEINIDKRKWGGFPPNRTYNFETGRAFFYHTDDLKKAEKDRRKVYIYPTANYGTDSNGFVSWVSMTDRAYLFYNQGRYGDWPPDYDRCFPLPFSWSQDEMYIRTAIADRVNIANHLIDLTLQGRFDSNDPWQNIQDDTGKTTFRVSHTAKVTKLFDITKAGNLKEFRLIRSGTVNNIYNNLSISKVTATVSVPSSAYNCKVFGFIYNEKNYLIHLCKGFICVKDEEGNTIDSIECKALQDINLKEVKGCQMMSRFIFTHKSFPPKQMIFDGNNFNNISDYLLNNIPNVCFANETRLDLSSFTFSLSAVEGNITINCNTDFFNTTHVNQLMDGYISNSGVARITKYINTKQVEAVVLIPFSKVTGSSSFILRGGYEPVWSTKRGWPSCVAFGGERVFFNGSPSKGSYLCCSRINSYNDFNNVNNNSNEAINIEISTNEFDNIVELYFNKDLQIFTTIKEYIAPIDNMTPNDFYVYCVSKIGIAPYIKPISFQGTTLFIDKNLIGLIQLINTGTGDISYEKSNNNYSMQNLTIFNSNLVKNPISLVIDYNNIDGYGNFIYILNEDGNILQLAILPNNQIAINKMTINSMKVIDLIVVGSQLFFYYADNNNVSIAKFNKECITDNQSLISITQDEENVYITDLYNYKSNINLLLYDDNANIYVTFILDSNKQATINKEDVNYKGVTFPFVMNIGYLIEGKITINNQNIRGETNRIKKRIISHLITITGLNKNATINYNGVYKFKKLNDDDYITKIRSPTTWNETSNIEYVTDKDIELKSIELEIDY